MPDQDGLLAAVLADDRAWLLEQWTREQRTATATRAEFVSDAELERESAGLLDALADALGAGAAPGELTGEAWGDVRQVLTEMSAARGAAGYSQAETATFVFSLKRPVFARLQERAGGDAPALAAGLWAATTLLDRVGLFTVEAYQRLREQVIRRQEDELAELSTPVVKLWDGILALPLIGTLDSARTQVVMESLLERIAATGSTIAILDITGVPTVDTLVAQHLLKTVAAARLMGADCIISGIRPQIAQTIVQLGLSLEEVTTKANLADAVVVALARTGFVVARAADARP